MEDTGSSPGVELVPTGAPKYDPFGVERRRREVARLRYSQHKTETEIHQELAKLDPPIKCSQATVSRDLHAIRKQFRHYLSLKGFDPAVEVYKRIMRYEEREFLCMAQARETTDGAARATLIRAANDCSQLCTRLLQDVGLLDRRLGTLIVDDGKRADRIPSGVELQKEFDSINVTEGEIISEAELAWKYGDAAASTAAAESAKDSARDDEPEDAD